MAVFLAEHQIGFDANLVGFPSLGGCMGVVLEVPAGLYGFHFTPNSHRQAGAMQTFVNNHDPNALAAATHLYGSCRFGRRYAGADKAAAWRAEMIQVADMLGYTGPISGYDLSGSRHIPKDTKGAESAYLEYRLGGGGGCSVHFKRMAKMSATPGPAPGVGRVKRDPNSTGDDYVLINALLPVQNVAIDTTKTNSDAGKMHTAKDSAIKSFVYSG